MNQFNIVHTLRPWITRLFLLASIVPLLLISANAQTSATDGSTPAGMAPGAPAGSYSLGGFETVNYFNGNLNFNLPLLKVGGRGGVQNTIALKIEQKWQTVKSITGGITWPVPVGWEGMQVGYGPGVLIGRLAGTPSPTTCGGDQNEPSLLRLTFKASDGTEYELHDTLAYGDPGSTHFIDCMLMDTTLRGKEFVTADGTAATFLSDDDLYDAYPDMRDQLYPSGYLLLRDGTRYRIENGNIRSIQDRNGNKMTFDYDGGQVTTITDSLNRSVHITNPSSQTVPYSDTITYKGFGGATRTIKVWHDEMSTALRSGYTLKTYHDLFPTNGASTSSQFNPDVVTGVELPDGRFYHFKYNSYGELARVELPTGGAFEYDFDGGFSANSPGMYNPVGPYNNQPQIYRRVVERRVYADGSTLKSRMTISKPEETTNVGYAVVENFTAAGTRLTSERHYYYGSAKVDGYKRSTDYDSWKTGREWKTEISDSNGTTLLRSIQHTWQQGDMSDAARADNPQITQTLTTLADTNQVSKQTFAYDQYFNRSDVYEYDFGSGSAGALVRRTHTDFLTGTGYTSATTGSYLLSLPSQQSVFDGAGTRRALTTYEYDNYADDARHKPLVPRTGITGHNAAYTVLFTARGNATSVTSYGNAVAATGPVTTSAQYDVAGNVVASVDGLLKTSTISYADSFCNGTTCGGTFMANTFAFATTSTSPVPDSSGQYASSSAFVSTTVYDFWTGRPSSTTDANNQTTSMLYNDALDRPTQVLREAGTSVANQTTFAYDDTNRVITTTSDLNTLNDNALVSKVIYDGLGRTVETRQYEGGTNYIASQQQYDALSRVFKSSNPFRPWQSENPIWTTTAYDALGRVITVTTPDSAVVTTSYSGNTVRVTDQAGKARKSVTDGLGRLKEVYEDPSGLNYLTSYGYDTLDNLITVNQGSQTRNFVYDSLKRLTSATNPESGSVSYQYDNNGNLTQKTDARSIVNVYAYDALNRNTTLDYSNTSGSNPDITRIYDSATNGKGRLRESYSGGTETVGATVEHTKILSYDALGRPLDHRQRFKTASVWSAEYTTERTYNLAGGVIGQTYPSGKTVSYVYDTAGRTTSFSGNLGGPTRTYASGIIYSPLGGATKEEFGTDTALFNKSFYNSRGQLAEIRVSTSYTDATDTTWNRGAIINHYSNGYGCWGASCNAPDNNGNLKKQDVYIPLNDQLQNAPYTMWYQQYDYDSLNRLQRVHEYTGNTTLDWQQEYVYDRYGNRTIDQNVTKTWGAGINKKEFTVNTANNRLGVPSGQSGTMTYDNAGNLTTDTYSGSGATRAYDAENRMTSETQAGSVVAGAYTYNADGQRVRRKVNGVDTWQVYGIDGELLAEYAANANYTTPQKEYGYRNGQLLVTAEPSTTQQSSGVNVALASNGGTATGSSTLSSYVAGNVVDGSRRAINNTAWLDNTYASFPDWIEVSFNGSKTISEINVVTQQDDYQNLVEPTLSQTFSLYGLTAFDVQYWNGSAWATVTGGSVTGNNKVWRKLTFAAITTSKIRVVVNAGADNAYSRVVEVEAWEAPPPPVNVALAANGGTATGSSTYSSYVAGNVVDGSRRAINNTAWLDNTYASFPDWIEVSFNGSKTISEIDVVTQQDDYQNLVEPTLSQTLSLYGLTAFDVQYWNGSAWVTVTGGSVTGNNKVWRKFTFAAITTNKIRVVVNAGADNAFSRVVEVEAWGASAGSGPATINWLVADQLGTPRMVFDQTGALANVKRHDYLPFGEELNATQGSRTTALGYTGDTTRQKFTSKERDNETGLDYFLARYYSSTQGRFTSPDEFSGGPTELFAEVAAHNPTFYAELAEPQSLNKYQYGLNNPLKFVDPDGHQATIADTLNNAANQTQSVPIVSGLLRGAAIIVAGAGIVGTVYPAAAEANPAGTCSGMSDCSPTPQQWQDIYMRANPDKQQGAKGQQQGQSNTASPNPGNNNDKKPIFGEKGTQTTSTTVGSGKGWRVDVENSKPGQRPGQIHYQSGKTKLLYDSKTQSFVGASKTQNKQLLSDPNVQRAIKKGLKVLGESQ